MLIDKSSGVVGSVYPLRKAVVSGESEGKHPRFAQQHTTPVLAVAVAVVGERKGGRVVGGGGEEGLWKGGEEGGREGGY